jgi:D-alanyl-lipoteichoic acid acyltransferase DltB (MBOAT superfamily)
LGGNRGGTKKLVFNLFVVWFLTGLWHGANWTFIVWGLYYCVLLVLKRFTGFEKRLGIFSHVYTLFFVIIGWIIFRSENIISAKNYISLMFGFNANGVIDETFALYFSNGKWIVAIGILLSTPVVKICKNQFMRLNTTAYRIVSSIGLMILFTISVLVCIKSDYNPFIYFNF